MSLAHDTSDHYKRVLSFMRLAGQTVRDTPTLPTMEERKLRARLILEEALETIGALGLAPCIQVDDGRSVYLDEKEITFDQDDGGLDLAEIADGCADIMVVTTGTLIACGIHDLSLQKCVDENNLEKFGPGGYRREDGKWVKPLTHKPPDIARVLREQVERGP